MYKKLQRQQIAVLKQALEDIIDPMGNLTRSLEEGCVLDGHVALQLCNDTEYLKDIARQGLASLQALQDAYKRPTKVIFLDIDGVLNTNSAWLAYDERRYFDPTAVRLLRQLMLGAGARLVISSVWRKGSSYLGMAELLSIGGLGANCLYREPSAAQTEPAQAPHEPEAWRTSVGHDNPRGVLIQKWLETYGSDITHYAIIDDDIDMLPEQMDHFIHVDGAVGFNYRDYERARRVLGCAASEQFQRPFRGVGVGYDLPETDGSVDLPAAPASAENPSVPNCGVTPCRD